VEARAHKAALRGGENLVAAVGLPLDVGPRHWSYCNAKIESERSFS
jgi:hypothetical protein